MLIYIYIYIYIERERERERGSSHFISTGVVHHTCGDEEGKYISFKLQIKDFHSDGEGKYISFKLSSHFISTGMTMLFQRYSIFMDTSSYYCCLPY
jgi:hypothetical protein